MTDAKPPVPVEDDMLGYNLLVAAGFLTAESNALLRARTHINMRQYIALRHLRVRPELGSAELARRLFITPQSAGPLLGDLERLGYIERAAEAPGQKIAARLTDTGARVLGEGDAIIAALEHEHRERMPPGEAAALNTLLKTLLATLGER